MLFNFRKTKLFVYISNHSISKKTTTVSNFSRYFLGLVFVFFCVSTQAQKVKYKDLFPLLDAKRYDEAEPFLKTFLVQESDHPNANLQMGFVLESKTRKSDIFKDKDNISVFADSAIIYFNKFNTLLNEKEIKKRDEYYQEYNRRDLRTGKFGIKEQDIRYDIENRIKVLREYKSQVEEVNGYMSDAVRQYHTAKSSFIYLSRSEQTLQEFFLAASLVTEESLEYMSQSYDSSLISIKKAQEILEEIEIEDYLQSIDYQPIDDYKSDGYSDADFYSESFTIWDYKEWAGRINGEIINEIKPLREDILAYSKKLNDVFVDQEPDLTKLNGVGSMGFKDKLLSYDVDPLPLKVFDYKKMEILFKIESDAGQNELMTDSTHVDHLLQAASNNVQILMEADTLINVFGDSDELKHEVKLHHDFVEQEFTNQESLENFINYKSDWLKQELLKWNGVLDSLTEASRYAYLESDTLMVAVQEDSSYFLMNNNVEVEDLLTLANAKSDSLDYFLGGLKLNEAGSTYFITRVAPSRNSIWYFEEPVDSFFDEQSGDSLTVKMHVIPAASNDAWMLIQLTNDKVEKGQLFRMNPEGKKLWVSEMAFSAKLESFAVDPESLDARITLDDGSSLVFDAEGKAK